MLIEATADGTVVIGPTGKWKVKWTGWKYNIDDIFLVGQWLAFPIDKSGNLDNTRPPYYSSTPGGAMQFKRGQCFWIDLQEDQKLVDHTTSDNEKDAERLMALKKLMPLIGIEEAVECY